MGGKFANLFSLALMLPIAACSSGAEPPSVALPKLTELTAALPEAPSAPQGSATDIYARVAQGAMGCWFSPKGGMKKDYIYHAEADAPSRGGKAEIVVHKRDPSQPNPRGAKAYKVLITPTGETSATVTTQNVHLPEAQATAMTDDVNRWAKGQTGCSAPVPAVQADATPVAPMPVEPAPTKAKVSQKGKPKPAQ